MFWLSDGVLVNQIHFSFGVSSTPDEIPLGHIYKIMNFFRQEDVLHEMVGNAT